MKKKVKKKFFEFQICLGRLPTKIRHWENEQCFQSLQNFCNKIIESNMNSNLDLAGFEIKTVGHSCFSKSIHSPRRF